MRNLKNNRLSLAQKKLLDKARSKGKAPIRKDVISKTLIRSLKRYYMNKFRITYDWDRIGWEAQTQKFQTLINELALETMTELGNSDLPFKELSSFLAILISPELSRK